VFNICKNYHAFTPLDIITDLFCCSVRFIKTDQNDHSAIYFLYNAVSWNIICHSCHSSLKYTFVHLYLYMDFSNIPGIMISIHSLLFLSSSQKKSFTKKKIGKIERFFSMTCKVFLGSVHVLTISQGSFTFCIIRDFFSSECESFSCTKASDGDDKIACHLYSDFHLFKSNIGAWKEQK